jgi:hypothetical protein
MALAKVGEFDCIEDGGSPEKGTDTAMTDIAVDRDGRIFGISSRMVFQDIQVGPNGVQCKGRGKVLPGDDALRFYGATFAPRGTISETSETLVVGDTEGNLYSVDGGSGDVRVLGNMGTVPSADGNGHSYAKAHRGKRWELSGDLVFLDNGGQPVGFATVRDCPNPPSQRGCNTTDTLVELNMAALRGGSGQSLTKALRGQIVKAPGCADTYAEGYGSMFGIAAYKGDIIGFSRDAYVVRIDNNRGGACRVADMKGMVPFGFSGAGVTTLAPVTVPPPR